MNSYQSGGIIKITREEATSSHVDDLLKRQMSMRGEPGVTRDRGRKWYYQSWLVLMIVGLLGALIAWVIIEPYFTEVIYQQGVISDIRIRTGTTPRNADDESVSEVSLLGQITIHGESIYLSSVSRERDAKGRMRPLDVNALEIGQTVGVYVRFFEGREEAVPVVVALVTNPPPARAASARIDLHAERAHRRVSGLLVFPLVAGMIGLFVGAADGIICRLPRRALLCGVVGLVVGLVGGFVCNIVAEVVYSPLTDLAMRQSKNTAYGLSTLGFVIQVFGRSLAWGLVGIAMGLGNGIALRSKRLLIYGLIGGVIGGLLGGMLFDPIDEIVGSDRMNAKWSRMIGFGVIGASVGGMIGLVELLARDTWLRMTQGPLTGKEFILFKDVMNVGSSPRSDIYLFNDPQVAPDHAIIRAMGEECEIEARDASFPVLLNNAQARRARLRHGDTVGIGRTIFVFQRRRG